MSTTEERLQEAAVALHVATVASCDCLTKTPNPTFHAPNCTYVRLLALIEQMEDIIALRLKRLNQ